MSNAPFYDRHRIIFNASAFTDDVHIIGCGGMGSHLAIGLARMGVRKMTLYDFDNFEEHNLHNQYLSTEYVQWRKVDAVAKQIEKIDRSIEVKRRHVKIDQAYNMSGVAFVCVDSMQSRQTIMECCLQDNQFMSAVIETRMNHAIGISHCFDPKISRHCDCWWEQFYPDNEADMGIGCGGTQSIISAILGTSALALKQFEWFAQKKSATNMHNRIYLDFNTLEVEAIEWPVNPHWD